MKNIFAVILLLLMPATVVLSQELNLPTVSQKATITQTVGVTQVTISYSRPGVKGRVIWGQLVPYDKVWRTGANQATTIVFSSEVTIDGQNVPAGTYSLHTLPGKEEWAVIFNKEADQWGSYNYDPAKDVLRIKVKPQQGPHQEWMMFSFPEVLPNSATVELAWEKLRITFKIETDTVKMALVNIKDAMTKMSDWRMPYRAADFAFTSNADNKEEAMKWIDQSLALKETYWNLRLKASMLAREGKTKEAIAVAEKAVQLGKENKDEPTEIEKTEKQIAEWKSKS